MPKAAQSNITKPTHTADPILARIATYKSLASECFRLSRLEEMGQVTLAELDRSTDALDLAGCKLAKTRPTTFDGASAMMTFITSHHVAGFFTCGEHRWHETAFRTVTTALARLTRGQSKRAA